MDRKIHTLILLIFSITIFSQNNKIESLIKKLDEINNEEERIVVLDSLTKQMVKINSSKQAKYLNEFIKLSKKQGNYDTAAEKSRFLIQDYINKGVLDSAAILIKNLLKNKEKFKKKNSEAHLLLKRGAYYYNKEMLDSAGVDYDKSGTLFLEGKDSIFAADARFFAGQVYFDQNNFTESVSRFEAAYQLYDKLGDKDYANYTLNELSSLYGKNGFHDKAIYERKRILEDAKNRQDARGMFYAYFHLFTSYRKKNELDTSKKYLDSMEISVEKIKEGRFKKQAKLRVCKTYTKYYIVKNNLDSIAKYLKSFESKLKADGGGSLYNKNVLLFYSAQYYKAKKDYQAAETNYKKLLNKNNRVGDVKMFVIANKELSEVLAIQNKYGESYQYLKEYSDAKNKENLRQKENTFLYYQAQFETQRKDNEILKKETDIALLEKDKELNKAKRRNLWFILFSIIILSVLIIYFIWRNNKIKRKVLAKKIEKNKIELESFTKQLIEKSKVQEALTLEIEKLKEESLSIKTVDKI